MPVFTYTASGGGIFDNLTSTSIFRVFGPGGNLTDISVSFVNLVHSYSSDLSMTLSANCSAFVTSQLFYDCRYDGNRSDFDGDYSFGAHGADFNTAANIGSTAIIPEGFYRAPAGLEDFLNAGGEGVEGTFILDVADTADLDEGSFDAVTLTLTTESQNAIIGGSRSGDMITLTSESATAGTMAYNGDSATYRALNGHFVILGFGGNDTITGADSDDQLYGGPGDDVLYGGAGNDRLSGGGGTDVLHGGLGNDTYQVFAAGDTTIENVASGNDLVISLGLSWTLSENIENLRLVAPTGNLTAALDGTGNDLDNIISGTGGSNILSGAEGDDTLFGRAGKDVLIGGAGNDRLVGGSNGDTLTGGEGADIFAYNFLWESSIGVVNADRITDFVTGVDVIDLSAIDANSTNLDADDSFNFIGMRGFSGTAGELRYRYDSAGNTILMVDVDGDGLKDMSVVLEGHVELFAGDFIL